MSDHDPILFAIETLTGECRDGFRRINGRIDAQDTRLDGVDKDVTRLKVYWTIVTTAAGFIIHAVKDYFTGASK